MNKLTLAFALVLAPALSACGPENPREASAAAAPRPVIEGVWHVSQIRLETGPDAGSHSLDIQPSVYIFSGTHYAVSAVDQFSGRGFLSNTPTETEMARAYAGFEGHTGSYVNDDDRLQLVPLVSKDPALMSSGAVLDYTLSWDGGDVWLRRTTPETGEIMTRLVRVDDGDIQLDPVSQRLQGVWRRVERMVDSGEEAGRHLEDIQPGYYIFEGDKFASNFVSSYAPRPPLGETPTDADLAAAFNGYSSFAGSYDINEDGSLVLWPTVTMNPNNMRGRPFRSFEMEWEGDDVWFIYTAADGAQNRTRLTPVTD